MSQQLRREAPAVCFPREQIEQTADGIRRLLEQVGDGTLTAGSGPVARLEGALAALDGLLDRKGPTDQEPPSEPQTGCGSSGGFGLVNRPGFSGDSVMWLRR